MAGSRRRPLRLPDYDYAQAGAYFVTICTYNRQCLFGNVVRGEMHLNALGRVAAECWNALPTHFRHVKLDTLCVMPNHIHGIVLIIASSDHDKTVGATHHYGGLWPASPLRSKGPPPHSLGAIVGSFKSAATKSIREMKSRPDFVVWQRNYYERVVRSEPELNRVRRYIANNPLHWAEDENYPAVQVLRSLPE